MFTESINYNKETRTITYLIVTQRYYSVPERKTPTLTIVSIIKTYIVFRRTIDESIWCRGASPCGMIQFTLTAWETANFHENSILVPSAQVRFKQENTYFFRRTPLSWTVSPFRTWKFLILYPMQNPRFLPQKNPQTKHAATAFALYNRLQ